MLVCMNLSAAPPTATAVANGISNSSFRTIAQPAIDASALKASVTASTATPVQFGQNVLGDFIASAFVPVPDRLLQGLQDTSAALSVALAFYLLVIGFSFVKKTKRSHLPRDQTFQAG